MERPYKSEHIFQTILNDLSSKRYNIDDKMDATSLYFSCETMLQNTREKNKKLAKYQMHKLIEEHDDLNTCFKDQMGIIFYPACAYFEYVYGSISLAESYIKRAIKLIGMYEDSNPNYVMAKIEQNINIYRIYKKRKEFEMCEELGVAIMSFMDNGLPNRHITKSPLFSQIPKNELDSFKKYFESVEIKLSC